MSEYAPVSVMICVGCSSVCCSKWVRKTFLTLGRVLVACGWGATMIDVRLTSSQRRQLSARLGATEDASYGRRLLAILALDEGESAAEVAERLGVTRQTVYNWARAFETGAEPQLSKAATAVAGPVFGRRNSKPCCGPLCSNA